MASCDATGNNFTWPSSEAMDHPGSERLRRERARVEAALRAMGAGFEHADGGGISSLNRETTSFEDDNESNPARSSVGSDACFNF